MPGGLPHGPHRNANWGEKRKRRLSGPTCSSGLGDGGDSRGGQIRPLKDLSLNPRPSPADCAANLARCPTRRFPPATTSMGETGRCPHGEARPGRTGARPLEPLLAAPNLTAHDAGLLPVRVCRAHLTEMAIPWRACNTAGSRLVRGLLTGAARTGVNDHKRL